MGLVLDKKLLVLILKTVGKQAEIEYVNLMVDIVNIILSDKELRKILLTTVIREENGEKLMYTGLLS